MIPQQHGKLSVLNKTSVAWMQQGLHYHQIGNVEQAQICYDKSLQHQADNYETLQLLGALMHKVGESKKAIVYLKKSLSLSPRQAHVINTLGNVYKASAQLELAQQQYELSLLTKPDYLDPYVNLGALLLSTEKIAELQSLIAKGEQYFSANWRFMVLKASLSKAQKKYHAAIELLLKANKLSPNQVTVLHDLGLAYRISGQPSQAIQCYERVEQLGHKSETFFHNYANALSDLAASNDALEYYSRALQFNPHARETLLNWCDLMWESGQAQHMFTAYEQALTSTDAPAEIYIDYIQKLMRVKQVESANEILQKMRMFHSRNVYCEIADIAIKRAHQHYEYDEQNVDTIFQYEDLDVNHHLEVIEYILEVGNTEYAYQKLMSLLPRFPDDQLLLALLHTCSRLLPEHSFPFERVEEYLFEYQIAPPKEMRLETYLDDLKAYLLTLHQSKEQPLEQTLHKGTQTRGNLFDISHPLLQHIKNQYQLAVQAYQKELAHLPELYPGFWQAKPTEFTGSWSVALKQSGFHNHHIHPMGWLSSACYIALPQISDSDNQGYFQVGVPNLANNGLGLPPLREVKPEPGKLVLFPSMLWHGTVPFTENNLRLSIACDIAYTD